MVPVEQIVGNEIIKSAKEVALDYSFTLTFIILN